MISPRVAPFLVWVLAAGPLAPSAFAAWVWSPDTGWIGPSGAVKDTPAEQLAYALGFFEQKDYERAEKEFTKLLKAYPKAPEAPEAQYYLGRCAEADGDSYKAFRAYRKTIQVYPSTARFEEILRYEYAVGEAFLGGQKRKLFGTAAILLARDKAIEIFQAIVDDGPFSPYGAQAQYKLGVTYLTLHEFEQAVSAFERLIDRYPDSELVDDARFQIAQASLKGTFSAAYDQSPTTHAVQELEQFLETHPESELSPEAGERLGELRERQAEHEFRVGQFYEQRGRPDAAAISYATIIESYGRTSWAAKAVARLSVLQRQL